MATYNSMVTLVQNDKTTLTVPQDKKMLDTRPTFWFKFANSDEENKIHVIYTYIYVLCIVTGGKQSQLLVLVLDFSLDWSLKIRLIKDHSKYMLYL